MRSALCFSSMIMFSVVAYAQQTPVSGPPIITQEERRGDIVCAVYRQYGAPDVFTVSASGNVDMVKQDIAGCIYALKGKMKRLEEGFNQQTFKKKS